MQDALAALERGSDLNTGEATTAMQDVVNGVASADTVERFAIALRAKGETADELTAMAQVMRGVMVSVAADGPILDTAGTGGDEKRSFNVSTVAAIVAAAAGARVAKQHDRAVTSRCGSTELLEEFDVAHDLPAEAAAGCLGETSICFLSTSAYHPAAYARLTGASEGRALMHLLSLLAHPAGAQHQLLGVGDARRAETVAEVLRRLGTTRSLVLRGDDGMDEITCTGTTTVHEVKADAITTWTIDPREFGYLLAPRHAMLGGRPAENALITRFLLEGKSSTYRSVAELNAAAALLAADRVASLTEGVALARDAVASGAALRTLQQVADVSQQLSARV
jgi:anthranilate phosphoribosyltransferase